MKIVISAKFHSNEKLATAEFFLCVNALANAYLLKKSEGGSKWLFNSYWVCTRNIIDENLNSLLTSMNNFFAYFLLRMKKVSDKVRWLIVARQ